ncbi:MAG: hypothetical protein ACI4T3_01365 [Lactobacillus sp.]
MAEKKLFVYYYSDPDAISKDLRCHAIYTDIEFSEIPWHVHTEKPSENLKDPVWSNEAGGWVENSKDNQGAMIAQQSEQIDTLMKANTELQKSSEAKNQEITELQKTIQQSNQATASLGQQFNTFGIQMTKAMKEVTTAINNMKKNEGSDK